MKDEVIFLHRKNRPIWEFRWSNLWCNVIHGWHHRTKYGNVYCVFQDLNIGKPFWIGRAFLKRDGEVHWINVTAEIRSSWIEFSNGGRYYFSRMRF